MSLPNKPFRTTDLVVQSFKSEHVLLSTHHVKASDGELMLKYDAPYLDYIVGGGFASAFSIPTSDAMLNLALANWRSFGFSEAFLEVMQSLYSRGYERVRFDSDGPVFNKFPTYDW